MILQYEACTSGRAILRMQSGLHTAMAAVAVYRLVEAVKTQH